MSSAVVLSSGGINSAVVFEIALRAHHPDTIHMLSFKYESTHNEQDALASLDLYHYYRDRDENVTWDQIELPDLFNKGTPLLLNTNLLLMTAYVAVINNSSYVYTGMHNERIEDLRSLKGVIFSNSHYTVHLKFPLIEMIKAEILRQAYDLEVPINLTWSCRQPFDQGVLGLPYVHCGECSSCKERVAGFDKVSVIDPVAYATKIDWYPMYKAWPYIGERQLRAGKL